MPRVLDVRYMVVGKIEMVQRFMSGETDSFKPGNTIINMYLQTVVSATKEKNKVLFQ